ncbi:hypothetical protein [Humidisolicoccus flavus]|uniref:hypothetical protein n=1 Tax=Humidisolicoccus flavus TaxID=3111414 RepID=UPI003246E499
MRWNQLFSDLEQQFDDELDAGPRERRILEERSRIAALTLRDRLLRAPRSLDLVLHNGERLQLHRRSIGKDWCNGTISGGGPIEAAAIVRLPAIERILFDESGILDSLNDTRAREIGAAGRVSFANVLRDLCRRRSFVDIRGVVNATGTIDRVGADHLDLAVHEPGTPRTRRHLQHTAVIRLDSIAWVCLND